MTVCLRHFNAAFEPAMAITLAPNTCAQEHTVCMAMIPALASYLITQSEMMDVARQFVLNRREVFDARLVI